MEDTSLEQKNEGNNNSKKGGFLAQMKWKSFLLGIATLLVLTGVFGIGYSVWAVKNMSKSSNILKVARVLNLPVARVNGIAIPYATYMEDVLTLDSFYSSAPEGVFPPVTEAEVSDQVLSRLIVNTLIKEIARENQIAITTDDIESAKQDIFAQYQSEAEVETELQEQYGWTIETYVNKIVRPLVVEQKVSEAFSVGDILADEDVNDPLEEVRASHILFRTDTEGADVDAVKEDAEALLERVKSGEDFAQLAMEFGSDSTKENGGDLGWFGRGTMVPEFEQAVFSAEVGQVTENLVETQFGYHIVMVTDKREVRDFATYLNNLLNEARLDILVKGVHDPLEEYRNLQAQNLEQTS